jgi:7,8-dihydroneopterin aldolase/epimerase/oxygenase
MNARIHLRNMAFYGYHGHLKAENALGQRFQIDLSLTTDIAEATRSDDLNDTVDYVTIYTLCREVVEGAHVKLLETVAARIMDRVLQDFPRVQKVEITIRKPSVPLPGVLDHVSLETSKSRE